MTAPMQFHNILVVLMVVGVVGLVRQAVPKKDLGFYLFTGKHVGKLGDAEFRDSGGDTKWFECVMVGKGGEIVGCKAVESPTMMGVYLISSELVPVSTHYTVHLTLAHVGERGGYPTHPDIIKTQFIGTKYPSSDPVYIEATNTSCVPHFIVKDGQNAKNLEYSWEGCGVPFGTDIEKCLKDKYLVIVGDSHMRSWVNATVEGTGNAGLVPSIGDLQAKSTHLEVADAGTVKYIRTEALVMTDKPASSSIPVDFRRGSDHTDHQINNLASLLPSLTGTSTTVVVNFGAWDLRDVSVEVYCERMKQFLKKLDDQGVYSAKLNGVNFVWRMTAPYSYNSAKFRETDYRTNEKIEAANHCVAGLLSEYPGVWGIHDTYRLAHPLFEETCDSHHYLCNPRDTRVTNTACPWFNSTGHSIMVGCAGKADLSNFLTSHHCPETLNTPVLPGTAVVTQPTPRLSFLPKYLIPLLFCPAAIVLYIAKRRPYIDDQGD
eukprot:TRINITY_DN25903_c0_g1_i2.p1 TRINITY_DN25903_c0_g1~~TRINITY_DN25903_c0_g1_i2.p1  ORF type:complete len:512 (+),score=71.18 TRINITY_DN25903_c0_g1_i2:70-1536(+)